MDDKSNGRLDEAVERAHAEIGALTISDVEYVDDTHQHGVSHLGKLGEICQEAIDALEESKAEALSRAQSQIAACDANIDYLRKLAEAHYQSENDHIKRSKKALEATRSIIAEYSTPYSPGFER